MAPSKVILSLNRPNNKLISFLVVNSGLIALEVGPITPPADSYWATTNESSIFGLGTLTQNAIVSVYAIAGLMLLVYLLYGSLRWLIASGDAKSIQGAKDTIVNAVIGIILLVASVFIVEIGTGVLGVASPFSISIPTLLP